MLQMGEFAKLKLEDKNIGSWMIMGKGDGNEIHDFDSMESSYENSSTNSEGSLDSDLTEDASSSYSSSSLSNLNSNSNSNGPLYELSELMLQLPIKRGLSKHYQGKSQSYTSLASVKSIEDLAKKGITYSKKRRNSCSKSYAGGLDHGHNKFYSPKPTISKKTPKASFFSLLGSRVTQ